MKKNILALFLDKLLAFPLWVKQVLYLKLYQNLTLSLSNDFIDLNEEDVFHQYVPILTFVGKTEMSERKGGFDANVYNFLTCVDEGLNMLEISMNNFWTMEEVAKYFILCLEQDYVKDPKSQYVLAMAGFMSGKYRIGEYFKRIGRINVDQLETVILKQKDYAAKGTPHKMAEIMIEFGFITEKETHSLLIIKEEAKKRFILDVSIVPEVRNQKKSETPTIEDRQLIEKLTKENTQLKEQLKKILAFVKKNG